MNLRCERFPEGIDNKLKSREFGPHMVLNKISSNASSLELPPDLQISPIFNVSDLYSFHELGWRNRKLLKSKLINNQKANQMLLKMCLCQRGYIKEGQPI